jgi:hypothetical protein
MIRQVGILTSYLMGATLTEPHTPPVAGNGALFSPYIKT